MSILATTTLCAALAAVVPAPPVNDPEHTCVQGAATPELWANGGAALKVYKLVCYAIQNGNVVPNLGFGPYPGEALPSGSGSIQRALDTWSQAAMRLDPADCASTAHDFSTFFFSTWQETAMGSTFVATNPCFDSAPNVAVNGENEFSMRSTDTALLGPMVVAITGVTTDATNTITEFDMLLNPQLKWADQDDSGNWYVNGPANMPPYTVINPPTNYYDLQGLVTHELGHALGIAHGLVDGIADDSDDPADALPAPSCGLPAGVETNTFPSMFYMMQGEAFANVQANDYDGSTWQPYTTPADVRLLGRPARTLTPDDVSALSQIHAQPEVATEYGSITGRVLYRDDGSTGLPAPGVAIVAVRAGAPGGDFVTSDNLADEFRVATLSFDDGEYSIGGLPEGDYVVWAEPVDDEYFADPISLPEWATFSSDCLSNDFPDDDFGMDVWNGAGEVYDEAGRYMRAERVAVGKGATTANIDFELDLTTCAPGDILTVSVDGATPSSRGAVTSFRIASLTLPPTSIRFDARFNLDPGTTASDYMALFFISQDRALSVVDDFVPQVPPNPAQLLQVYQTPVTGCQPCIGQTTPLFASIGPALVFDPDPSNPANPFGYPRAALLVDDTCPGSASVAQGTWSWTIADIPGAADPYSILSNYMRYENLFAQVWIVRIDDGSYDLIVSNPVNLFITG